MNGAGRTVVGNQVRCEYFIFSFADTQEFHLKERVIVLFLKENMINIDRRFVIEKLSKSTFCFWCNNQYLNVSLVFIESKFTKLKLPMHLMEELKNVKNVKLVQKGNIFVHTCLVFLAQVIFLVNLLTPEEYLLIPSPPIVYLLLIEIVVVVVMMTGGGRVLSRGARDIHYL